MDQSNEVSEFDRCPLMTHETDDDADAGYGGLDDVPLLPHERPSAMNEGSGSEFVSERDFPAFTHKSTHSLFARRTSSRIWKARSSVSSLPHSLPRSDAEDENLHDPSLERFPTQHQRIIEHVATIRSHMPEDDSVRCPLDTGSPELTIMSQACSSVDLAPISSHTSLHRIAEDALLETDEDEESTLDSPVMELSFRAGAGASSSVGPASKAAVSGDDMPTPMPQKKRDEYFSQDKIQHETSKTDTENEDVAASVQKDDGAGDSAPTVTHLWTPEAIARPASALDPILTTPCTQSERIGAQSNDRAAMAAKDSTKINFAEPTPREDREDSPPVRRDNVLVRAWDKLKLTIA
jgi:hypothetical protein